jgi:hypothetical protein
MSPKITSLGRLAGRPVDLRRRPRAFRQDPRDTLTKFAVARRSAGELRKTASRKSIAPYAASESNFPRVFVRGGRRALLEAVRADQQNGQPQTGDLLAEGSDDAENSAGRRGAAWPLSADRQGWPA